MYLTNGQSLIPVQTISNVLLGHHLILQLRLTNMLLHKPYFRDVVATDYVHLWYFSLKTIYVSRYQGLQNSYGEKLMSSQEATNSKGEDDVNAKNINSPCR